MPSAKPEIGRSLRDLYPNVAAQWHPTLNDMTPDEVRAKSGKRAWWICSLGHVWLADIHSRTGIFLPGCRVCANQQVLAGFNDLATHNPKLASEWDYEANGKITPSMVTPLSSRRFAWVCILGHRWESRVLDRAKPSKSSGCPICSNKRLLTGFNDLATRFPEVAKEWDYSRNEGLTPSGIIYGSNKHCDWICNQGHQWRAKASRRATNNLNTKRGCPGCMIIQGSHIETAFHLAFSQCDFLIDVYESSERIPLIWRGRKSATVDISGKLAANNQPVAIEYDGILWHAANGWSNSSDVVQRDMDKTIALLAAGYIVIRMRENELPHLPITHQNLLQISNQYSLKVEDIAVAISLVKLWITKK